MEYALAKRLKDGGWPQPEVSPDPDENLYPGKHVFEHDDFDAEMVYEPTTDELFEALPKYLENIGKARDTLVIRWEASPLGGGQWAVGYNSMQHNKKYRSQKLRASLSELWLTPEVQAEIKKKETKK
jgi:hypothetical protein